MKTTLKKKLLIIAPIMFVVLIALGGVVAYAIWADASNDNTPAPAETSTPSVSYGACDIVTSAMIKETFGGEEVTNISSPTQSNETAPNGTSADVCRYTFATEYSSRNTFSVSVYQYSDGAEDTIGEGWSEVGGSTPIAYFGTGEAEGGTMTTYGYRILPGSTNVVLTLSQPTETQTFPQDAAFDFIGGIAANANLEAIDENLSGSTSNPEPGGISEDL